jgi:glycosyltransferase involved in cell wall biosynthesis
LNVTTIYNPVAQPNLKNLKHSPLEHTRIGHRPEEVLILSAGALHPRKDFPTLIRAFHVLRQQRPAKLVILGEGEARPELQTLIRDLSLGQDVALPGYADNVHAWMTRADLFVMSSQVEGFCLVLIEAMACGCPVVSTDCPSGPAEILQQGRYGPLVPVGNYRTLAWAMASSLQRPVEPETLRARAADFSVDASCSAYLRALLGERATTRSVSDE